MGMNVNLTPQLEELVRSKVASGMYTSASEVVREALRWYPHLGEDDVRMTLVHAGATILNSKALPEGTRVEAFIPTRMQETCRAWAIRE